jgi:hypothetical protein
MYRVTERRPNLRRASAAATLILLTSVAAPTNLDAQTVVPPTASEAPSVRRAPIAGLNTTRHTPGDHSRSPGVTGWTTAVQRLDPSGSPRTHAHAPELTFLDQPTPVQRDTISWAVGRFVAADLQLPDLDIRFPVYCNGKGALYHVGKSSVDFCRVNRKNVLHELAHAWDDTSGVVDRQGFMNLRGVTVWFGGLDVPAPEQGSEHLAIIIAWALMDPGTGSAHGLPHNSDTELIEAFELLTHSSWSRAPRDLVSPSH